MGFYTKKRLYEAVINGEDQDDNPGIGDYTSDDDDNLTNPETTDPPAEEPDPPADDTPPATEEEPESDYTADGDDEPNEGDTVSTNDTPPTAEEPAQAEDPPADDAELQTQTGDDATPTDYTIPDDAEPQTSDDNMDAAPTDDAGDEGADDDYTSDDNTDTGDDEPTAGDTPPTDDGGGETDYTDDGDDAEETGDAEGTDSAGDEDTGGSDDSSSTTTGSINNDLKAKENELFADLTDEQRAIRDIELKGLFAVLYDSVDDIINRINNIHKTEYTLDVFEFISTKLTELKTLIHYNLTVTFPTKSYIENQITYQECLAVLNTVEEMLKTVEKTSNSDENT